MQLLNLHVIKSFGPLLSRFVMVFFITFVSLNHVDYLFASSSPELEKAIAMVETNGEVYQALVIDAVKKIGPNAYPILNQHLSSQNANVKNAILVALSLTNAPCQEFSSRLPILLSDKNWMVQNNTLYYLSTSKCQITKANVRDALARETNVNLIKAEIDYLGNVGDSVDYDRLKLIQDNKNSPNAIRLRACRALAMLGQPYNSELVHDALQSSDRLIIIEGIKVLEKTSDTRALTWLEPLLQRDNDIGRKALQAREWIHLNDPNMTDQQKSDYLFNLINNGPDNLKSWAAYRVLEKFPGQLKINQLKALVQEGTHATSDMDQKERAMAVFEVLESKGLMTQDDLPKGIR